MSENTQYYNLDSLSSTFLGKVENEHVNIKTLLACLLSTGYRLSFFKRVLQDSPFDHTLATVRSDKSLVTMWENFAQGMASNPGTIHNTASYWASAVDFSSAYPPDINVALQNMVSKEEVIKNMLEASITSNDFSLPVQNYVDEGGYRSVESANVVIALFKELSKSINRVVVSM